MPFSAVIFDMDGVLIDSEQIWDEVREELTKETSGTWTADAQTKMMGMSSPEWSKFMSESLHVPMDPAKISDVVVERMIDRYKVSVPVLPQAVEAVTHLANRLPLAVASSSNRPVIDAVLERLQLTNCFAATVSSEEVQRGKPAPDVYLEAARRLDTEPTACVAVEDSSNGIRAASAAGMTVIAVPNPHYPPARDALDQATISLPNLYELTNDLFFEKLKDLT